MRSGTTHSELWQAVHTLSLPAKEQLDIIWAAGKLCGIDELAISFEDFSWLLDEGEGQSELTESELLALRLLDQKLDQMSGEANSSIWTVEALYSFECWDEVRKLATAALMSRATPDINEPS